MKTEQEELEAIHQKREKKMDIEEKKEMITIDFRLNGELIDSIDIPEPWGLSEGKTYEQSYKAGRISVGRTGLSYSLWLERPLEKIREELGWS